MGPVLFDCDTRTHQDNAILADPDTVIMEPIAVATIASPPRRQRHAAETAAPPSQYDRRYAPAVSDKVLTMDPDVGAETGPVEAVRALLCSAGISARRLRTVVGILTQGRHTLASVVQQSAVDRRSVESVLAALDSDLEDDATGMWIAPSRVDTYRDLIGFEGLAANRLADPLERLLVGAADVVDQLNRWVADAPKPRHALDHVSATGETAVRRALWLNATFDLDGARLLCVGDHDLTSLALAAVNPRVAVTVVDIDDAILEFIDSRARLAGWAIRCLYTDLRFALPVGAREWGDLVFTDPPYTPEGVRLFLSRGLEGLRDRHHARLVMAYGFAENHPALGLKAQQAIGGLQLAYEAVLPDFHRYHGAQAVGSSSDLYVLRPTARSWKVVEQGSRESAVNIYTHGAQSLEGRRAGLAQEVVDAIRAAAAGPATLPIAGLVGDAWGEAPDTPTIGLDVVFAAALPATVADQAVAVDLIDDPGGWLVRALLAIDARRVAILVRNNHPDLANEAGQKGLTELVAAKYRLRLRRSTPGSRFAIVEADRRDTADLDPPGQAVRAVLDRAHGRVANTWREALIRASKGAGGATLTKNEARARISAHANSVAVLEEQLLSLPRHQLSDVLADVATSARIAAG
jgi:hypothetical protein